MATTYADEMPDPPEKVETHQKPPGPTWWRRVGQKKTCPDEGLDQGQGSGYGAVLVATLIFLPGVAAAFTVLLMLLGPSDWYRLTPLLGTAGAFIACLVSSFFWHRNADAPHGIPGSYAELLPRLDELKMRLDGLKSATEAPHQLTAYCEALKEYDEIRKDLRSKGLTWLSATGYSRVWGRLLSAEEALIEIAPKSDVLEGACYDAARLRGSDIVDREELMTKLCGAVVALEPRAHQYLKPTGAVVAPPALAIATTTLPGGTVAVGYCAALSAAGGMPPYQWAPAAGAIPDALVLAPAGVLHGTPTTEGLAHFAVQVTDDAGVTVQKSFDLLISPCTAATKSTLAFSTTSPLPCGTAGVEYTGRLFATGGKPPYTWKEIRGHCEGTIPHGLHLNPDGVLTGKLVGDNPCELEAQVTDGASPKPKSIRRKFTLAVKPAGTPEASPAAAEQLPRAVLRHVRNSVNAYRKTRWNGLILARNRLLVTFLFTEIVVFALLAIAVMNGAGKEQIVAATVFYLVGAMIGLWNRLRPESQTESAVPDYGLSVTRLITLPLFSGLSALGGVLLMAYLPLAAPALVPRTPGPARNATSVSQPAPGASEETVAGASMPPVGTPPADANQTATQTGGRVKLIASGQTVPADGGGSAGSEENTSKDRPQLRNVFNLKENLIGVFLAMVFGLTPSQLFDRLQQQTDRYKSDLEKSQSTQGPKNCSPKD